MDYRVKVQHADTGWTIEDRTVPTFRDAVALMNRWFREFHGPIVDEWGVRPGLINLPVAVDITGTCRPVLCDALGVNEGKAP